MEIASTNKPQSLTSNQVKDFWFLGGLSILIWLLFIIFDPMKANSELISTRFVQVGTLFSWLSFICNYPHFLISYRFAYTRGIKFILQSWIPLIAVPLTLLFLYMMSYFYFNETISNNSAIIYLNSLLLKTGLAFQIGEQANLGTEILAFSVRIMYITVGWHYAKQIFGCMMVYGNYSSYNFSLRQKQLIKISLFSIAFFNFFFVSIPAADATTSTGYFFNIPLNAIGFSVLFITFFKYAVLITSALVLYFVFYKNYQKTKKLPPLNVLVGYVAFHIWWFPPIRQNEFYFLTIPFFHSLQYLPFAYRLEVARGEKSNKENFFISLKMIALVVAGILAFETIPHFLDTELNSINHFNTWFFMISFAVFINIHHFFIDSVIWKFNHKDIRDKILS
jgi:hypothetical protein